MREGIHTQSLDYINTNYDNELLEHLRENIFHVTTIQAYESIQRDGFIYSNKKDEYSINAGSQLSFGRHRGWVCLFDLREKSDKEIEETLACYNFLRPRWFVKHWADYSEWKLAYLLLSPQCYGYIVTKPSNDGTGYTQYIPQSECWYPEDLPFNCIQTVIQVNIHEQVQKDKPLLYALHMIELEEQNKKKGCQQVIPTIE